MDIKREDKHFTTPLVGDPDDRERKHPAEAGQGEIEVSYKTYSQRDPHIRVTHTTGGETDRYTFRIVDELRHQCAPRSDFEEIPLPVLQAIYLCGYYVEAVESNITHHALTELSKTVDYLNDYKQAHDDIPTFYKRLHLMITRLEDMGCLLVDLCLFSPEAFNSAISYLPEKDNESMFPREVAVNLRRYERLDITPDFHAVLDRPWPDFINSEPPTLEEYCDTSQEYPAPPSHSYLDEYEAPRVYASPATNNIPTENVTAYDIAERKEIETTRIIELDNGDILVNHISQTGVEHFYLNQNGEDEYVCQTPATRFIDPVIYEILHDDNDITITNIYSASHMGDIVELHEYLPEFAVEFSGTLNDEIGVLDEGEFSTMWLNAAFMSVAPEEYQLANKKAVEIYENELEYHKEVDEVWPGTEEYNVLSDIVVELLPDDALRETMSVMPDMDDVKGELNLNEMPL